MFKSNKAEIKTNKLWFSSSKVNKIQFNANKIKRVAWCKPRVMYLQKHSTWMSESAKF